MTRWQCDTWDLTLLPKRKKLARRFHFEASVSTAQFDATPHHGGQLASENAAVATRVFAAILAHEKKTKIKHA